MNKTFRSIWNESKQAYVAAAEIVSSAGKRASSALALVAPALLLGMMASTAGAADLPIGGQVVGGAGSVVTSGNQMTVKQATNKLAIDWQSFSIGQGRSVEFVQPSASAVALNRVLGSDVSVIQGALKANGQVFFVNPNGVLFSPTAQVDVGGLVASTQSITTADFMAGRYHFSGTSTAQLVNQGRITAGAGGTIALIAARVVNTGQVSALGGQVGLAAANTVTLDLGGPVMLRVSEGALNAAIEQGGVIRAEGGRIWLTARSADMLAASVINHTGTSEARTMGEVTGSVSLAGDIVVQTGQVDASATTGRGGEIAVQAATLIDAGTTTASGALAGGRVTMQADSLLQTTAARVSADSAHGTGGQVSLLGGLGPEGRAWLSGSVSATGVHGGSIATSANAVTAAGWQVNASGQGKAGDIRVGGGWQGKDATLANAATTTIGSDVSLVNNGTGGRVVVWSDEKTVFGGAIEAPNSAVEVSGKEELLFAGTAKSASLLLDPRNITIATPGQAVFNVLTFANPSGSAVAGFGTQVAELSNGNLLITAPSESVGGVTRVGAVYLLSQGGALIATLTGVQASDCVGSGGVTALSSGNYVVVSKDWDNGTVSNAGAVTWGSGVTGVSGFVSSANSLVGTSTNDSVGTIGITGNSGVTALSNGSYVVRSENWDDGGLSNAGAVTWGSGTLGVMGAVSSVNSLVGSKANDSVGGGGLTALSNGNYVVRSNNWDNDAAVNAGAVTWGSGSAGVTGAVSSVNSLVGSTAGDGIGNSIAVLSNGNYVVWSDVWDNGGLSNAGAVTWGSAAVGVSGALSSANSLVGGASRSFVGNGGVTALTNGNYVVASPDWGSVVGAVTWGNGTLGVKGVVSSANSLVGSYANNDCVGSGGVKALSNGNYVVSSPRWRNGTLLLAGAVTWGNGTAGISGAVSTTNSLVGAMANTYVGSGGVTVLSNGHYVVQSPNWEAFAGAVTWVDGRAKATGTVSSSNSLVGSTAGDCVGSYNSVTALSNGNYVVASPQWTNGTVANVGSVTWVDGSASFSGPISSTNSLVGSTAGDSVGSAGVKVLTNNGNYVVHSPLWDGSMAANAGALTWGNGTAGVVGSVSVMNSLVGSTAGDFVGNSLATALSNGNYLLISSSWDNGAVANAGAVTWGSGSAGVSGVISSANSLVGSTAEDKLGYGAQAYLNNGNYAILSSTWDNGTKTDTGAVTWGSGVTGVSGVVNSANSLLGTAAGSGSIWKLRSLGNRIVVNMPGQGDRVYVAEGRGAVVAPGASFTDNSSENVTVTPASLTALLDAGTAVTLQANNDITLAEAVTVTGTGATLTLLAGRNIIINDVLTTNNANFVAVAGTLNPDLVSAQRDSGTATLSIGNAGQINAGTGTVTLVGSVFNNSNSASTATTAGLVNLFLPTWNAGGVTTLTLGGINLTGKRYSTRYTESNGTITANCNFDGCVLPSSGFNVLYAAAPSLQVAPRTDQTSAYGQNFTSNTAHTLSGFVDGDASGSAGITGTAAFTVGGSQSVAGHWTAGSHDVAYSSGLLSSLGYQFQDKSSQSGELNVARATLSMTSITASDKVYNGTSTATIGTTSALLNGKMVGDDVGLAVGSANFADKNVGNNKTVTYSLTLSGNDAANYNFFDGSGTTTANITRLDSVSWTGGGPTSNWFDPANWAGGAVPDLANVANVVIPSGVTVNFTTSGALTPADASGAVRLDSIRGASAALTQASGALEVGSGGMTLASFGQTGGSTSLVGDLTVSNSFSQGVSGTLVIQGSANLTDTSGGMTLGNLQVGGTLAATSTGGSITQAASTAVAVTGAATVNAGANDVALSGATNNFTSQVNVTGKDVTVVDGTGGLQLGNVTASGTLAATSTGGAITQASGTAVAVTGTASLDAGANNDFGTRVNVTGKDVTVVDVKNPSSPAEAAVALASGMFGVERQQILLSPVATRGGFAGLVSAAGVAEPLCAGSGGCVAVTEAGIRLMEE